LRACVFLALMLGAVEASRFRAGGLARNTTEKEQKALEKRLDEAEGTHPQNCHQLFAYEASVKTCLSLQEMICGKSCDLVMKDDPTCKELQELLCHHPARPPAEKAIALKPKIPPTNEKRAKVTVCNAYPSAVNVDIHHNKHYVLPDPVVVEDLEYMQCVQFDANGEEELIFKVGDHSHGLTVLGDDVDHLVLFGQYEVGKKEPGFRHFGWADEGFGRPIVCSAYPGAQPGRFFIDGKSEYPFSNAQNTAGLLGYMECEKIALDRKDLHVKADKMGASFAEGKTLSFEVSAAPTLFMIGDDTATHKPRVKTYRFSNLKNKLSEEENGRRFYVPHYPEQLGKPPMTSA